MNLDIPYMAYLPAKKYPSLSGTATPSDFVEFPSQFNEHAALEPDILKNYAIIIKLKSNTTKIW